MKTTEKFKRRSRRSRGRKRRVIAASAVGLLALVVVAALFAHARSSVVSFPAHRRHTMALVATSSSTPWSASQRDTLRRALHDAFAPALAGSDAHSLAVIGADGQTLYDDAATRGVTPASVQKLVVAYTALNLLGPRYRFQTMLAAQRPVATDGTLDGNLWIVGSGDPSLSDAALRAGFVSLARAGLARITGGIVVDPSAMHGPEINPHWDPSDANEDFQAPTSGVSLDGDTVEFRVHGTSPGAPARVAVVPESDAVRAHGRVMTSAGSDGVIIAADDEPNTFRMDGTILAGAEEHYVLPIHDVPHYVGAVADRLSRDAKVAVTQRPSVGAAPLAAIALWQERSAPLTALERFMLYRSDNHYAEQLLRTLGGDAGAAPTDGDGIAVEQRFLALRDIPAPQLHLVDGSGLARANRIAAITLARILSDADRRGGEAGLYLLLPQGGRQGTLKHYGFTSALGRVRAKSGHLTGVDSLAGYVSTLHHGRVSFAFMINGSPGAPDDAIVRAVDRLASL